MGVTYRAIQAIAPGKLQTVGTAGGRAPDGTCSRAHRSLWKYAHPSRHIGCYEPLAHLGETMNETEKP
jgi:hypothetical protein